MLRFLPRWAEKLLDKLLVEVIAGASLVVLLAVWPDFRQWLSESDVYNWVVLALGLACVLLLAEVMRVPDRNRRLQKPRNTSEGETGSNETSSIYVPIRVDDETLGLFYIVEEPPSDWIAGDVRDLTPHYVDDVIRGPYDAVDDCAGQVESSISIGFDSFDIIPAECPHCEREIDIDRYCETDHTFPGLPEAKPFTVVRMKRAVMLRLQRDYLNKIDIEAKSEVQYDDIAYTATDY